MANFIRNAFRRAPEWAGLLIGRNVEAEARVQFLEMLEERFESPIIRTMEKVGKASVFTGAFIHSLLYGAKDVATEETLSPIRPIVGALIIGGFTVQLTAEIISKLPKLPECVSLSIC